MTIVIGLISGTSADGIDAAIVELTGTTLDLQVNLLAGKTYPYADDLRSRILEVCHGAPLSMQAFAELDDAIAHAFADAALAVQQGQPAATLIGSHGQTVFHRPPTAAPHTLGYSLQLGRGAVIAQRTQIPTVNNFRAADIAVGGQGAPLVSPVDACLLSHPTRDRCIQNIGGIGNVTYLPAVESLGLPHNAPASSYFAHVKGWDTGPGNSLIDLAVQILSDGQQTYDANGAWAAQGIPCEELVAQWLHDPFFSQAPPKSTGREWFGQAYAHRCLADASERSLCAADTLATLTDFTAASIADSYRRFLPHLPADVILGGGGSRNAYLVERLRNHLASAKVLVSEEFGISVDFKEAIAFAVLAYWNDQNIVGNIPTVTGAKKAVVLGDRHPGAVG
ncbi:MAG: anhydro-N-acetylmuramic acid kinase [Synechococcales cyanobacterium T60_A2020_003]|nr:anhydro-N-acetylmuramic acid kinase [Synechococcales cyanobacterium T60_A2020_003]